MINAIQPDSIEKITIKKNISLYEQVENHERALKVLPLLGIRIVAVGPTDLMEGKLTAVLGILWQLVRVRIFFYISF